MFENINLEYLKTFYLVAKEGNITKVAEKNFISQSAVTQTIQKLEKILGYTLFIRNKKGIELTRVGKQLLEKLVPVFSYLDATNTFFENLDAMKQGEIKIACGTNLAKKVLLRPIDNFLNDYENIKIKQYDGVSSEFEEMLMNSKIDIFITQKDEKLTEKFNFLHILTEKYVFVCSKWYFDNKYAKGERNYILQGSGSNSRKIFDNYSASHNLEYKTNLEVAGYNMLIELCKKNKGIAMLPLYMIEKEIEDKSLVVIESDNLPQLEYVAYTNKFVENKLIDKFLKYLVEDKITSK